MKTHLALAMVAILLPMVLCDTVHVGDVTCSGMISVDSQFFLDPIWSLSPLIERAKEASDGTLTFSKTSIPHSVGSIIKTHSGLNPSNTLIFRLSGSSDGCSFGLDPLKASMDGTVASTIQIVLLDVSSSDSGICSYPTSVGVSTVEKQQTAKLSVLSHSDFLFSPSVTIGIENSQLPLAVTVEPFCSVQILILTDRHGGINYWYVWIPTAAYSTLVVLAFFPIFFMRASTPNFVVAVLLGLVFIGYLGSFAALGIEIIMWQGSIGRLFPFPPAVTLYCCLVVFFGILFIPLIIWRSSRKDSRVLLIGSIRLLTYGGCCAMCISYWVGGFCILGIISIAQYCITNLLLVGSLAYLSICLCKVGGDRVKERLFNSFVFFWFAPFTPFAPCATMYFDLRALGTPDAHSDSDYNRLRDVIFIHNIRISVFLLFLQDICGVCLLVVASCYHVPFVILLCPCFVLTALHAVYVIEQYPREWRRWKRRGIAPVSWIDKFLFRSAMNFVLMDGSRYGSEARRSLQPESRAIRKSHQSVPADFDGSEFQLRHRFQPSDTESNNCTDGRHREQTIATFAFHPQSDGSGTMNLNGHSSQQPSDIESSNDEAYWPNCVTK